MTDLFWNIFKKSGNVEAFMAYKEFSRLKKDNNNNLFDINNNTSSKEKTMQWGKKWAIY